MMMTIFKKLDKLLAASLIKLVPMLSRKVVVTLPLTNRINLTKNTTLLSTRQVPRRERWTRYRPRSTPVEQLLKPAASIHSPKKQTRMSKSLMMIRSTIHSLKRTIKNQLTPKLIHLSQMFSPWRQNKLKMSKKRCLMKHRSKRISSLSKLKRLKWIKNGGRSKKTRIGMNNAKTPLT